jgi:hypothetical protein
MLSCPRCQAALAPAAVECPRCRFTLKAFGHPGIPLHRTEGEEALCATCVYHADDSCNFPQRPDAQTCTLYRSVNLEPEPEISSVALGQRLRWWLSRHTGIVALAGLLLLSMVLVLANG